mgnify:CR=1 FL=1
MSKGWEHFSHIADVGVKGWGETLEEAFEQGALAMTAVMCEPERIKTEKAIDIELEEPDIELLFADWLNKLIYETAVNNMLFSKFKIKISEGKLKAKAWGEEVEIKRHESAVEIKGATYTELKVGKNENNQWFAQCVLDV